jgi:hypothetical protein
MRTVMIDLDAALTDWRTGLGLVDAAALAVAAALVLDEFAWSDGGHERR